MREERDVEGALQDRLGYRFQDPGLLRTALTHRSAAHERSSQEHYERLEFLGDAVIGLVTSDWLYHRYPEWDEGELSRLKSRLVSASALAEHSESLAVGDCLRIGRGEERSGGRRKQSLLVDALEAVVGAVFLEAGFGEAQRVVAGLLEGCASRIDQPLPLVEAKNRLQEKLQSRGLELPSYVVRSESGPAHEKSFVVEVFAEGEMLGSGEGSSKKSAEQRAAKAALEALDEQV